jgi:carbon-monoxide dehydrogenase large subunit
VQTTVYHVPRVHYRVRAVLTHTMATGAYRGAGRPEANFLIERLLEKAAREMKLDPAELRRRNFIRPDAFPYRTHLADTYDGGNFSVVLDKLLAHADWAGFPARRRASERAGRLRGRGLSVYLEWTGALPTETVDIEVNANGEITVFSGTQAMGQGLETSYTQLVTEVLGVPATKVKIVQGDTDRANGVGSVGSRSAFVGGSAGVAAGRRVIVEGKTLAAEALEAAAADIEYRDGRFRIAGTDRAIELGELAARQERRVLRVTATETPSTPSWPNGAQMCEVEIDRETGEVKMASIASCDDVGRIINVMIVEGQVHGGIAQGASQALYEEVVRDDDGNVRTASFAEYGIPSAAELPSFTRVECVTPTPVNPLGVKGIGESGTIGATPAVHNAVIDALAPFGVVHIDMPCTPERVWRAMHGDHPEVRITRR